MKIFNYLYNFLFILLLLLLLNKKADWLPVPQWLIVTVLFVWVILFFIRTYLRFKRK
jgi:hypothetical protein